jgi:hypothetical protein
VALSAPGTTSFPQSRASLWFRLGIARQPVHAMLAMSSPSRPSTPVQYFARELRTRPCRALGKHHDSFCQYCLPPSEALPHQTAYDVAVGPAPAPASSDVDDPPHPAVLSRFKQASGTFSHAMALLRCTLHANLAPPAAEHARAGPLHCWNATPFLFLFYFDQDRRPGPGTNEVKRTAGYRRRFPASENAHCTQTCSISPDFPCGREQRQDADRGSRVVPPFCLPCGVLPLPVAGEEPAIN